MPRARFDFERSSDDSERNSVSGLSFAPLLTGLFTNKAVNKLTNALVNIQHCAPNHLRSVLLLSIYEPRDWRLLRSHASFVVK